MYSLIVPVYKNESNINALINDLHLINISLNKKLEVIFVIDGSPDNSFSVINQLLDDLPFPTVLIELSRNFGAIDAIRSGLSKGSGPFYGVMAADQQEPPDLIIRMFQTLRNEDVDVVLGKRISRVDPILTKVLSRVYWHFYKKFIVKDLPRGGVDIFAFNNRFRDELLSLQEANSSLIGLIYWLGFRRKYIEYSRKKRRIGESSHTITKKLNYFLNSIFSFSDLPIKILIASGILGVIVSISLAVIIVISRLSGSYDVPGYAASVSINLFFAGLNCLGLGIIGSYTWRCYENSKKRPLYVVMNETSNKKKFVPRDPKERFTLNEPPHLPSIENNLITRGETLNL